MATLKLTDKAVLAAKAPSGERLELWDEQTPGLCLRVSDKGKKVWVYRYRTPDGRQPRLTLGDYSGAHGVRWARDEVESLRVDIRKGADPAAERKKARLAAKSQAIKTFDDLADAYLLAMERGEWMPRNKRQRARTIEDERGILRRHVRPALGKLRLEDIDRPTVRRLLRAMAQRGIGAQTNRTHAVIRQAFSYAMGEERVTFNPAVGFLAVVQQKPRTRTLTDEELRALWNTLEGWPNNLRKPAKEDGAEGELVTVSRPMRIVLLLCTLVLQRRGEVAGMAKAELNLEQRLWLIPGDRMKGGLPHLVPLPDRAVKLIEEALKLAPADSPFVFPSPRDPAKPILANSVTHAMKDVTCALGIEGVSPHDLRRTGSTALTSERLGIAPFIRSKVLSHRSDTGGGAAVSAIHYDANSYIADKRRALEAWESLLLTIVGERHPGENVRKLAAVQ